MQESGSQWADQPFALPDRYRIEGVLGRGGFGTVVLAEDQQLGRRCAIKVARDSVHDARLVREARCASGLRGPHVVRIFDVDVLDSGASYVVMEYLDGQTLAQYLSKNGRVPWRTAVSWLEQVCMGLEEAHRAGLVHRDIKPSNLFLVSDPITETTVVKVLDFGLARSVDVQEGPLTDSNLVLGSPSYMSPEQVRNSDVGPLSDIWSLGVVLYQLVSGEHPFRHDTKSATLAAIVADSPRPLEALVPGLPHALVLLVERCLSKRPDDRFASAWDLARCLKHLSREGADPATAWGAAASSAAAADTQETSVPLLRPGVARAQLQLLLGGMFAALVVVLLGWSLLRAQLSTAPPPALARIPDPGTVAPRAQFVATVPPTSRTRSAPETEPGSTAARDAGNRGAVHMPPRAAASGDPRPTPSESGLFEEPDF